MQTRNFHPQLDCEPICSLAPPSVRRPPGPRHCTSYELPGDAVTLVPRPHASGQALRALTGVLTLNAKGARSRGEEAFMEEVTFLLERWLGIYIFFNQKQEYRHLDF